MRAFPRIGSILVAAVLVSGATPATVAADSAEVRETSFRLLNEGVAAYTRGDFEDAEDKLARATSMALNDFRAYLYHGLSLAGLRRYDEALAALEIALDLEPTHLGALVALGDVHLALGDVGEARAAYYRAIKERPEYPAGLDGLARTYEASADRPRAIELYRRAITSDPGFSPAYTHLGELYLRQSRFREAVELLTEAVSIRPDNAAGLNRLALAYSRLGLYNEAVATVERAIVLEPYNPEHHAALGSIQVDLGLLGRAEESFRAALELDPGDPMALAGTAEIARRRGRLDDALALLDRALEDPRLRAFVRDRLTAQRERLRIERARLAELKRAEETGEIDADGIRELAALYAGQGRFDTAADLEARLPAPSDDDLARRAYLELRAGRYREALATYDRISTDTAERADRQLNRGVALAGLGREQDAIAAFDLAARSDDEEIAARAGLYRANALFRAGREQDAARGYAGFLKRSPDGEDAERVRRILAQIAPDLLPTPVETTTEALDPTLETAPESAEGGTR